MCEICKQSPCHNMCPNADPPPNPKVIGWCDNPDCKEKELYDDETHYKDNADNTFCSIDCALAFYGIEEVNGNG